MDLLSFILVFFAKTWEFFLIKIPGTNVTFFAAFGLFTLLAIVIKIVKIFAGGDDGDGGSSK